MIRLACAFFLAATPAFATPPQIVSVSETLMGLDAEHIYVLRILDDNMGYYMSSQQDVLLIARSLDGNTDDEVWPVLRTHDVGADDGVERLKVLPLEQRFDPFGIFAERRVRPLIGAGWTADEAGAGPEGLRIRQDDTVYALGWEAVGESIAASLEQTRTVLPPVKVEGEDMLLTAGFDPETDCHLTGTRMLEDGIPEAFARVRAVAEVTCENDNSLAPIQMLLVLPPA